MIIEYPRFNVGDDLDTALWSGTGDFSLISRFRWDRSFEGLAELSRIRVSRLVPLKNVPHVSLFICDHTLNISVEVME